MKILFLMKPYDGMNYTKDTSYILMKGAVERGHSVYYLPQGNITLKGTEALFDVEELAVEEPLKKKQDITLHSNDIDAIFVRTDPPFDAQYIMDTLLLDRLPKHIKVVNSGHGIRDVNEKIFATQFTDITPTTLISSQRLHLTEFLQEHGTCILKPTDGFGGAGIFKVSPDSDNLSVILETLTENFSREIIAQAYVPAAEKGDKRILLLNGEPLGAVLRVHKKGEHRNNFFAGGTEEPTTITEHDLKIVERIKPYLIERGLFFVGIDIIGDSLIEINVTSPTCLQEMNRLYSKGLHQEVIEALENL
jgi:glutathione synthase